MRDSIPTILLVEDNSTDVLLTRQAFEACSANVDLQVVSDGLQALNYLYRRPPYVDAARPDLILLDLNLPKCDGWEVLAEVKSNGDLRCIPLIVLTTSNNEDDVRRAYHLHANCYMIKPMAFNEFSAAIGKLNRFWLSAATLTRS